MSAPIAIFLDFNLPNATTWFFFSLLLAVALFFKFSRFVSIRNLDVVLLFLLVPGLLMVQAARAIPTSPANQPEIQIASLIGQGALVEGAGMTARVGLFAQQCGPQLEAHRWSWLGYLWLLAGSVIFFCRCLFDMTLVQRPAVTANLQIGGLAWLAGTMLICLLAVAYRQADRQANPPPTPTTDGPATSLLDAPDQAVFAVAILWRQWPAWAVATLAFACHIAIVLGLVLVGWRHYQDLPAGMAAATFYLMLPYTGQSVGQLHHVLPMALFIGALVTYRYPTLAGCILGVASAATYFPVLVLPLWLSFYRHNGAGRFLGAFVLGLALGLVNIGLTLSYCGELDQSIHWALESAAWQPWKVPTTEIGFWTGVPWAYRIPVFLLFVSFVIGTMFWPAPKNLAHLIAMSAAVFIGLQFWCADHGGTYVLWYLPLLLLLVFRPNLQDRVAQPIPADTDWLTRATRWCVRMIRRALKLPEPEQAKKVAKLA